jgi:hypothetical protein
LPSSRMVKSSFDSGLAGFPDLSVTTTSSTTSREVARRVVMGAS